MQSVQAVRRMYLVSNPDLDRSRGAKQTVDGHKMHAI
jgi:hypothetical protein